VPGNSAVGKKKDESSGEDSDEEDEGEHDIVVESEGEDWDGIHESSGDNAQDEDDD